MTAARIIGRKLPGPISVAGRMGSAPGFTPIGAALYDRDYTSDPVSRRPLRFRVGDITIDGTFTNFRLAGSDLTPPSFDTGKWLRYIWYDDGFGAANGNFTVPAGESGIYACYAYILFDIINGIADNAILRVFLNPSNPPMSTLTLAEDSVEGATTYAGTVTLNAFGIGYIGEGSVVEMDMHWNMSGLSGPVFEPAPLPTTTIVALAEATTSDPPPYSNGRRRGGSFFAIQKIADTLTT